MKRLAMAVLMAAILLSCASADTILYTSNTFLNNGIVDGQTTNPVLSNVLFTYNGGTTMTVTLNNTTTTVNSDDENLDYVILDYSALAGLSGVSVTGQTGTAVTSMSSTGTYTTGAYTGSNWTTQTCSGGIFSGQMILSPASATCAGFGAPGTSTIQGSVVGAPASNGKYVTGNGTGSGNGITGTMAQGDLPMFFESTTITLSVPNMTLADFESWVNAGNFSISGGSGSTDKFDSGVGLGYGPDNAPDQDDFLATTPKLTPGCTGNGCTPPPCTGNGCTPPATPEPGSIVLAGLGLCALGLVARRKLQAR